MAPIATSAVRQQQQRGGGGKLSRQGTREALYQEATQAFLTCDYVTTHEALNRLLALVPSQPETASLWYEAARTGSTAGWNNEKWRSKIVKLAITSYAGLCKAKPPSQKAIEKLLGVSPPITASWALQQGLELCQAQYGAVNRLENIPATMMVTLVMNALKLGQEGVNRGKIIIEDWLAVLPQKAFDAFQGTTGAEGAREDYLRVIELYVGEILTREEEWEMASVFLQSESVMSSKRKESLFLNLRELKMKARSSMVPALASPPALSASMEIPPSVSPSPSRSRSSSSSSERTARPVVPTHASQSMAIPQRASRKGKERATKAETEGEEELTAPQLSDVGRSTKSTAMEAAMSTWTLVTERLPKGLIPSLKRPVTLLPLPLFMAILIYLFRSLFHRRPPTTVRDRLRMRQDWKQWLIWWLVQSWQKTRGVLKLGTTITYI